MSSLPLTLLPPSSPSSSSSAYSVCIIGCGASGLSSALFLLSNNISNILLLDSRDRIGGRVSTIKSSDGFPLDVGAAYFGPRQNRVNYYLKKYKLRTKKVYTEGKVIITLQVGEKDNDNKKVEKRILYSGLIPPLHPFSLLTLNSLLHTIQSLSNDMLPYLSSPSLHPKAEYFDRITVSQWLLSHTTNDDIIQIFSATIKSLSCVEIYETSMLSLIVAMASSYGIMNTIEVDGGAQERKIIGGVEGMMNGMREEVERGGGRVMLNSAVREVKYNNENHNDPITIITRDGRIFHSDNIIIAIPPSLYSTLLFSPPLPLYKSHISSRLYSGSIIKTILRYDLPYWRMKGFSGQSVDNNGYVVATYDDCQIRGGEESVKGGGYMKTILKNNNNILHRNKDKDEKDNDKPNGEDNSPINNNFYAIIGFLLANQCRHLSSLPPSTRCSLIAAEYKKSFGIEEMGNPIEYYEYNWEDDEWSKGCYSANAGPGLMTLPPIAINPSSSSSSYPPPPLSPPSLPLTSPTLHSSQYDHLSTPIHSNRISFCSTEFASRWIGYVDGALQSGEKAASEVIKGGKGMGWGEEDGRWRIKFKEEWEDREDDEMKRKVVGSGNGHGIFDGQALLNKIEKWLPSGETAKQMLLSSAVGVAALGVGVAWWRSKL